MKKIILFSVFLFAFLNSQAQIIDFPDANFKNALLTHSGTVDTNGDGEIQVSEAEARTSLDVRSQSISSLEGIEYFINLVTLRCNDNLISQLDVTPFTNLQYLYVQDNLFTSFTIPNLTELRTVRCENNQLTSLTVEAQTISSLDCGNNQITNLDLSSMTSLSSLYCGDNQLTSLNLGTLNLNVLVCENNQLTSIDVSSSTNLQFLICSNNQLATLDLSNQTEEFVQLECSNNNLTTLEIESLTSVGVLRCGNNQISSLTISSGIWDLGVGTNQLTSIDLSNFTNLTDLSVGGNFLTTIDVSDSPNLDGLFCENNLLTSIDISNNPIIHNLYANNNALTSINLGIGEFLYWPGDVHFDGNPDIAVICTIENNFDDVQDLLTLYGYTDCTISTYCSFEPNGEYFLVQGQSKYDENSDGCDVSDSPIPHLQYNITSNTIYDNFISNANGDYTLYVDSGSHVISPILENPSYFTITPPEITVSFPTDTNPYIEDFCISPNGIHKDMDIQILPLTAATPGFQANYRILYSNTGNTLIDFGQVLLTNDFDLMEDVSFDPSWDSFTLVDNAWHFNFEDLQPFETRTIDFSMQINTPTDTPAVNGGDVLTFVANYFIEYDLIDPETAFTLEQTVVNSFDPNDKTCLEGTFITPEMVGDYVHYMIRFENTGTADAVNIVVKDHIDITKYDLSSLVSLDASHNFFANIKDNAPDHYVEFIFENINLPFDDANNDGFIAFKIKTLDTLVLDDIIENEAEIYFDFNFPIITNIAQTTVATLSVDDFEIDANISIYPNPVQNELFINSKDAIERISIYDLSGRLIREKNIIGNQLQTSISTEKLSASLYFIKVKTAQNEFTKRIVKE